jgi:rSAM/selenodomain-associated transferase 2
MTGPQGTGEGAAIIIPTLDEAERITGQVERCLTLRPRPEVIVADGGSRDDTCSRAESSGAKVVISPRRGRAFQMNAGAAAGGGDVLVFLHADVILRQGAFESMLEALNDPALAGGAFRRRFDSPSPLLRLGCRLADLRGRWIRIFLGDQAIFVRRSAFQSVGGYPEILLFEDLEFSRRLSRVGRTVLLREKVVASSRRFRREGVPWQILKNLYLTALYLAGADPSRLARRYDPEHFPSCREGTRLAAEGTSPGGAESGAAPGGEG